MRFVEIANSLAGVYMDCAIKLVVSDSLNRGLVCVRSTVRSTLYSVRAMLYTVRVIW